MERYDRLRAEGTDPVEVMRRVAPALTPRRCGPGSRAWPDRAALTEQARHPAARGRRDHPLPGRDRHHPARHRPAGARPARTPHYEARAGSLGDPVRMASRSLSESPPQTPWGSGAANA